MLTAYSRKVTGLILVLVILVGSVVFSVLYFGNVLDDKHNEDSTYNDLKQNVTESQFHSTRITSGTSSKAAHKDVSLITPDSASGGSETLAPSQSSMPSSEMTSFHSNISKANINDDSVTSTKDIIYTDTHRDGISHPIDDVTDSDTDLDYRLFLNLPANETSSSGQLYVEHAGRIGFVCQDGFDGNAARVACRQMGYRHGFPYHIMGQHTQWEAYTMYDPLISGINCTGTESRLDECEGFRLTNETSCSWFAAALCYNDKPYELRLFNGTNRHSGLVEMKVGGEWRVFCAIRNFDDDLADILCRMMNYTGGITLDRGELGPTTYDKVWVPYIYCGNGAPMKYSIFECELILHPENILFDHWTYWANRYNHEYMSCMDPRNSFAAAIQCLKHDEWEIN